METIQIQAQNHTYEVQVGKDIFPLLLSKIENRLPNVSNILIVIDSNVEEFYSQTIRDVFSENKGVSYYIVPAGEQSKAVSVYYDLMTFAIESGLDRKSLMVAIGGGMVGDLTGFVSATYMRGIPFVQVPTTVLAHDSAVGGKVAINHELGKNLMGAFHQPELVLYDQNFLLTLPMQEWRSGYAELFKHALLDNAAFVGALLDADGWDELKKQITHNLVKGISVKKRFVEEDVKESGIRAALNLGHTLAHGLETHFNYKGITHGEAVAVGLLFDLFASGKIELASSVYSHFKSLGYEFYMNQLNAEVLVPLMLKDKKNVRQQIRLVLLQDIGKVYFKDFSADEIAIQINNFKEYLLSKEKEDRT